MDAKRIPTANVREYLCGYGFVERCLACEAALQGCRPYLRKSALIGGWSLLFAERLLAPRF